MKTFTLITALTLCSFSWISVSGSESQTVEVQSGEEVTLTCSNMSSYPCPTWWSRLVNGTKTSCITFMYSADDNVRYCGGVQNWKYNMRSNISTVFLKIKDVDLSDSGQYFCVYLSGRLTFSEIRTLNIKEPDLFIYETDLFINETDLFINETDLFINETHDDVDSQCEMSDGTAKLTSMILGGLTVFLVMIIIGLAVKIKTLQKDRVEEQNPQRTKNQGSDDLNYAAVTFHPKTDRNHRPAPDREVEPNVIYSSMR